MIADILMYISIICVFVSLIPACISDYKTRLVDPKIWRPSAYIGIPCGIFAFILKLINNEIVVPSLILLLGLVLLVLLVTVALATIKDPFYNPSNCPQCSYTFANKSDILKCPRCNYVTARSILGGADMIAIDIIMLTSFYISQSFVPTLIFSIIIVSAVTIAIVMGISKTVNYRVPLIIPITFGYAITLVLSFLSIDVTSIIQIFI
jgi:hypothetical protein